MNHRTLGSRRIGPSIALVIALAITSIIGLATAGAASFLSAGHAQTEAQYESLETARAALRQIQKSLRSACLVTCSVDDQALVYWRGDENGDGEIDLTELRVLQFDSTADTVELHWVSLPDGWPAWYRDMMDKPMTLMEAQDPNRINANLMQSGFRVSRTLASDVADFSISPVGTEPMATMVRMGITTGQEPRTIALRSAVALRAPGTGFVRDFGNGVYVYDGPDGD